jgi:hypothetical protein
VKGPLFFEKGGYVYSVGYWPPTFSSEDAIKYATAQACREIANVGGVKVIQKYRDLIIANKSNTEHYNDDQTIIEENLYSNKKISGLEPCAVWLDKEGEIRGQKGGAFVLVRIKEDMLNQIIKNYLDSQAVKTEKK